MNEWSLVPLRDILKRSRIGIDIEDNICYKRVTIRTHHQGVSLRDEEVGKNIGTKKQFVLRKGQFVLSKIDARYGAFGIAPDEVEGAIITGNFWAYDIDKDKVTVEWINHFTNSREFYNLCERASSGVTHRKYLDEDVFLSQKIPLPSKDLQISILYELGKRFTAIDHIKEQILNQENYLLQLRQSILQEAIEGKLTADWRKQNPFRRGDPNTDAVALLEKIKQEKQELIAEGKIKKEKPLEPIKSENIPFELPEGWLWCRFGQFVTLERGRFSIRPRNDKSCFGGKYPFIQIGSLSESGDKITEYKQTLNEKGYSVSKEFEEGTVVIAIVGGTIGNLGILGFNMCFPDSIVGIRPSNVRNQSFTLLLLRHEQSKIRKAAYQMAGQPNIKIPTLAELIIPLPPLGEQQIIVERVNLLLSKVSDLEMQIKERSFRIDELMQMVLMEAFEGGAG